MNIFIEDTDNKEYFNLNNSEVSSDHIRHFSEVGNYSIVIDRKGAAERNCAYKILVDGEELSVLAERRDSTLEWTSCGNLVRTKPFQLFEDIAGPLRFELQHKADISKNWSTVFEKGVFIDPTKMGGWAHFARLLQDMAKSPLPFPCGPKRIPTAAHFERWVFIRVLHALEKILGNKMNFIVKGWATPIPGTIFTSGPSGIIDLSPIKRLRLRHEPAIMPLTATSLPDALHSRNGNPQRPLRPDIVLELLETRDGAWCLTGAVVIDVKYTAGSQLRKWALLDNKYGGQIVSSTGSIVRLLGLVASGEPTGLSEGPLNVSVDNVFPNGDGWQFAPREYQRRGLVVFPNDESLKLFEAFVGMSLKTILG